jgi:hypothetical protein
VRVASSSLNRVQNTDKIAHHLIVPDPEDAVAASFDPTGTRGIRPLIGVRRAIDFHDQFRSYAEEIGDEGSDRDLPPEFQAIELGIAQRTPEYGFRRSRFSAHRARVA